MDQMDWYNLLGAHGSCKRISQLKSFRQVHSWCQVIDFRATPSMDLIHHRITENFFPGCCIFYSMLKKKLYFAQSPLCSRWGRRFEGKQFAKLTGQANNSAQEIPNSWTWGLCQRCWIAMPTSLLTPTVLKPLLVGKDYTILHMGNRLTGKCLK